MNVAQAAIQDLLMAAAHLATAILVKLVEQLKSVLAKAVVHIS